MLVVGQKEEEELGYSRFSFVHKAEHDECEHNSAVGNNHIVAHARIELKRDKHVRGNYESRGYEHDIL